MEWQSMPSSSNIPTFPREGGPPNNITFTFWADPRSGQLSGPSLKVNTLIHTGMVSMLAEGIRCHGGATEAFVAYDAQLIMYHVLR